MAHPTKIATCCYCGTRAALVLTGRERHELACSGCGAPLHELKAIPVSAKRKPQSNPWPSAEARRPKPKKKPKKSKRKSRFGYLAREAFDLIEDIFD
ncbi:MAG: hypothetical protein QNJ16_15345 [Rhodobacter sp.]|nr:hypothetical protein [Rhodobacter sp.]